MPMKRTPMRRTGFLKRGKRLAPVSKKVRAGRGTFQAVYHEVDARSGGRCEYPRCPRLATDHHHLYKPRRAHHEAALIAHLCRPHHDRCERSYDRGRLVISLIGGRHIYRVIYAADKWAARVGQ